MESTAATMNLIEWVERLGGWGALLLIVRWMLTRLDATLRAVEETQAQIVSTMSKMEVSLEDIARNTEAIHDQDGVA